MPKETKAFTLTPKYFGVTYQRQGGFTLVELLIAISIMLILSVVALSGLSEYGKRQSLISSQRIVRSALEEARSKTLSSEGASQYGLYFTVGSSTVTLFKGGSYSSTSPDNEVSRFDKRVKILSFEGLDIGSSTTLVFERLTGNLMATGTIVLGLIGDENATTGVVTTKTGIIRDE